MTQDAGALLKLADELKWRSNDLDYDAVDQKIFASTEKFIRQAASQGSAGGEAETSWSRIDSELSAYVKAVRSDLIEQCAKEAERCDTHALFCMANPASIRSDIASRIRALSPPVKTGGEAEARSVVQINYALRGEIADAIREYCHSVSPAAVQNSHGVERIYYSGISLDGLTDAVFAILHPAQEVKDPFAAIPTNLFWMAAKGRLESSEPLYAVQIIDPESGIHITEAEAETLDEAVAASVHQFNTGQK